MNRLINAALLVALVATQLATEIVAASESVLANDPKRGQEIFASVSEPEGQQEHERQLKSGKGEKSSKGKSEKSSKGKSEKSSKGKSGKSSKGKSGKSYRY